MKKKDPTSCSAVVCVVFFLVRFLFRVRDIMTLNCFLFLGPWLEFNYSYHTWDRHATTASSESATASEPHCAQRTFWCLCHVSFVHLLFYLMFRICVVRDITTLNCDATTLNCELAFFGVLHLCGGVVVWWFGGV